MRHNNKNIYSSISRIFKEFKEDGMNFRKNIISVSGTDKDILSILLFLDPGGIHLLE
jgi:hypothetical protein